MRNISGVPPHHPRSLVATLSNLLTHQSSHPAGKDSYQPATSIYNSRSIGADMEYMLPRYPYHTAPNARSIGHELSYLCAVFACLVAR